MEPSNTFFKLKTTISVPAIEQLRLCYTRACFMGPAIGGYMLQMIEHGRMEQRIIDGCKALLALRLVYGELRLDQACIRGLCGNKYTYTVIKNILLNHLEQAPAPPDSETPDPQGTRGTKVAHENLRGSSFFDI